MTRVNFYEVQGGFDATLALACRLAEKAFKQQIETLLFCPDEASAMELDKLLWRQTDTSFIPHQLITPQQPSTQAQNQSQGQDEPLVSNPSVNAKPINFIDITWGEDVANHHGMLINLVAETPSWFSRFETLAEIVNADPEEKKLKRERYSFYRDRGYPLAYHNLTKSHSSKTHSTQNSH